MGTLFFLSREKSLCASRRLAHGSRLIRRNRAERPHSCLACQYEIQRVGGSQRQAVLQEFTLYPEVQVKIMF